MYRRSAIHTSITRRTAKGVVEMREHFGPGWRMYYTLRGDQLIVMLGGGSKSSQRTDIALVQRRAAMIEEG